MSIYAVILDSTNVCDNVISWDDTLGPWTPPADHYTVDIDGLSVGIGFYYDPATQLWTAPPTVTASFNPTPIFLSQSTVLSWDVPGASSVTLSALPGQTFPATGTQTYTPSSVGTFTETITATWVGGTVQGQASVKTVATQAQLETVVV